MSADQDFEGSALASAERDLMWMREALAWAQRAQDRGDVPVGAVVVLDGQVIGRGYNTREDRGDPLGHAELMAIREAGQRVNRWRLDGATLYVTLEPCVMCAGAIVNSRIARLVYGAEDAKAGAVQSLFQICNDPRLNHRLQVSAGVEKHKCAQILVDFFGACRKHRGSTGPKRLRGYEHTAGGRSRGGRSR